MSAPEPAKPARGRSAKTLLAVAWVYGARANGLLWTLALIHQLGISDYGLYSVAFALMSIVFHTLNNPYLVRATRESEADFVKERASRYLLGVALIVVGQVLFPINYVAWFGITVSGGELCVGAMKARALRDGDPNRSSRIDTTRHAASVVLGCAYLFGLPLFSAAHPTLLGASLAYCAPYAVIVVLAGIAVRGHRPQLPGPPRVILVLAGEMLGTSLFLQGDVLLLGWLTNTTVVGYYTLAWVVASAVVFVGQAFGTTYTRSLRDAEGDLSAGPPLRFTATIGLAGGLLVFLIGVGLMVSSAPRELAIAMMIMSAYCAFRTVIMVFQFFLYAQRRDIIRLTAVIALVPFKFGLLAVLAHRGAVGAAVATSVCDAVLFVVFTVALYGKGRRDKDSAIRSANPPDE